MIFFDITKFWNYLFKLNIKKMNSVDLDNISDGNIEDI